MVPDEGTKLRVISQELPSFGSLLREMLVDLDGQVEFAGQDMGGLERLSFRARDDQGRPQRHQLRCQALRTCYPARG